MTQTASPPVGHYFEDLAVGMRAELSREAAEADVIAFAQVTGDVNPVHLDADYAATTMFKERIAHGMLSAGYISALLGVHLPGPGAIYVSQTLSFRRPVKLGALVHAQVEITALDPAKGRVTLACVCAVDGKTVMDGEAVVIAPRRPA